MNILIIEDQDFKLETTIRILKEHGITRYTHFNNYSEGMNLMRDTDLKEFDVIILDLTFYECRPVGSINEPPSSGIGYLFLYYMIEYEIEKKVIIYSSEENYLDGWKDFLFPSFEEFCKIHENSLIYRSYYSLKEEYKDRNERNSEILPKLNFVIGHAHNEHELCELISSNLLHFPTNSDII